MANAYFQFKQFIVHQEHAAMKVTTDACVFGAWARQQISPSSNPQRLLDIGCGTGLLSFMLAQDTTLMIDAVERNEDALKDAAKNINSNQLQERIQLIYSDIKIFQPEYQYDYIICNPPFFKNDLKSPNNNINLARHEDELDIHDIMQVLKSLMKADGKAFLLQPYYRWEEVKATIANAGFFIERETLFRHQADKTPIRVMFSITRTPQATQINALRLKDINGNYTDEIKQLLAPYYLIF